MEFSIERILADERLSAELLARLRPGRPEGLESVGPGRATDTLRRLLEDEPQLEKIVNEDGRPVLTIRGDSFDVAKAAYWSEPLELARPVIERAIRSVGRVDLTNGSSPWAGTAWVVADGIVATNRHVARLFATRRGEGFVFRSAPGGLTTSAAIDFLHEHESSETRSVAVADILHIAPDVEGEPDLALLRLAPTAVPLVPIPLHPRSAADDQYVVVVGYPAWDPDEEDLNKAVFTKYFQGVFDVKRLSPGQILSAGPGATFTHDCSTLGGNSGSVVLDLATGKAVGLHYAGRSRSANWAVKAEVVATRLAALGPTPTIEVRGTGLRPAAVSVVRPAEFFAGREGYRDTFLGAEFPVAMPAPGKKWRDDLQIPTGSQDPYLRYTHFTVAMTRSRKLALFTAVNIDGGQLRRLVRRKDEVWYLDGRLPVEGQIGGDLYVGNPLDRGHLVRRLDPVWGADATAADEDTFHYTNACPQHEELNRKTWLSLEDHLLEAAEVHDLKVSVFTGPVLAETDQPYRGDTRLPQRYWKVAVMLLGPDQRLSATGYLLSQRDLVEDLEFAYGAFRTYQVSIAYLETITGLDFGPLRAHDPLGAVESPNIHHQIESAEDLVLRPPVNDKPSWETVVETLGLAAKPPVETPAGRTSGRDLDQELQAAIGRLEAGETMPPALLKRALTMLKSERKFAGMIRLSDAARVTASKEWPLRHLRAQALIDSGKIDQAITELGQLEREIGKELGAIAAPTSMPIVPAVEAGERRTQLRRDLAEVVGLLGRSYKQRCIDAAQTGTIEARREDARQSLRRYAEAYLVAPMENLWHGINYVALAKYAVATLGLPPPQLDPDGVARKLLVTIDGLEERGLATVWDLGTRAEALLALGEREKAKQAYARYLGHPEINSFGVESSRRQLAQIWRISAADDLMTVFGAQARDAIRPAEQLQSRHLDAAYSGVNVDPRSLSRSRAVARLGRDLTVGDGTGFLFDGALISPKLAGKRLLMTCAHVCPGLIDPKSLVTIFFGPPGEEAAKVIVSYAELIWTSPKEDLDASLLFLKGGPDGIVPAPLSPDPVAIDGAAYLIGHPLGGAKFASLDGSKIREVTSDEFYYSSATDPGSSGSPVFDGQWRLTGIHRRADSSKELNVARRLDVVLKRIRDANL